jgi:hypothetical protein
VKAFFAALPEERAKHMTRQPPSDRELRERRLHYRFMRRIYRLCRSGQWGLRYVKMTGNRSVASQVGKDLADGNFLWDAVGCVDIARQIIYIDYRCDVLATFVHECLHVLIGSRYVPMNHDEEERHVQRLEKLIMSRMSPLQAKRLHTEMALLLHADADDPDRDDFDD